MDRSFDIGDTVLCIESGVVGEVLSFYTPTSCEKQTMVLTDDGRKYHAPTNCWVKFDGAKRKHSPSKLSMSGISSISIDFVNTNEPKVVILSKDISQSLVNDIRKALTNKVNYDGSY